jgi:lysophospholipase L1-like esterase
VTTTDVTFGRFCYSLDTTNSIATQATRWPWQALQGDTTITPTVPQLRAAGATTLVRYATPMACRASDPAGYTQALPPAQVQSSWLLKDSSGTVITRNNGDDQAIDPGNTAFQQAAGQNLVSICQSQGWDGIMLDEINADPTWAYPGNRPDVYPDNASWQAACLALVQALASALHTAGLKLWINLGQAGNSWDQTITQACDGSNQEYWIGRSGYADPSTASTANGVWAQQLSWAQWNEQQGIASIYHCSTTDANVATYALATFLLISEGHGIFSASPDAYDNTDVWNVNDFTAALNLGAPSGAYTTSETTYTRQFANGTVTVDPTAMTATIQETTPVSTPTTITCLIEGVDGTKATGTISIGSNATLTDDADGIIYGEVPSTFQVTAGALVDCSVPPSSGGGILPSNSAYTFVVKTDVWVETFQAVVPASSTPVNLATIYENRLNPTAPASGTAFIPLSQAGVAGGVATLGSDGLVPASQLPAGSGSGGTGSVTSVNGKTGVVTLVASDVGAYAKPSTGIPATDMDSSVQASLAKANSACQGETYDGVTVTDNAALRAWFAAVAARDTAPAKVLVVGGSTTEGAGAPDIAHRWQDKCRSALRRRLPTTAGLATGGETYIPVAYAYDGAPVPWTVTGTPTAQWWGYGLGGRASTLTVSGQSLSLTFTGTSAQVWFTGGSDTNNNGTVSVALDGGTAVNVTPTKTGTRGSGWVYQVPAFTSGTHTLTVTWVSGKVTVEGAAIFNGDESSGLQWYDAAQDGDTSDNWATTTNDSPSAIPWLGAVHTIQPNLVIVQLGVDDYLNNVASATFQSNVTALVTAVRAQCTKSPSILFILDYQPGGATQSEPWANYVAALKTIAAADTGGPKGVSGIAVWDLSTRFPAPSVDNTLGLSGDMIRPSATGYGLIADALANYLMPR